MLEIAASDLDDKNAMTKHFHRLAKHLIGKDKAEEIKNDGGWFGCADR